MANDTTITAELDAIARLLEDLANITVSAGLATDTEIVTRLRRIREALPDAISNSITIITDTRSVSFIVQDPENIKTNAGRGTKSFEVWLNDTGRDLQLTRIFAMSDADDYTFQLFSSASNIDVGTGSDIPIATVPCSTDGTGGFYADITAFDSDIVPDGTWIIFEHVSGSAETLSVLIKGILQ